MLRSTMIVIRSIRILIHAPCRCDRSVPPHRSAGRVRRRWRRRQLERRRRHRSAAGSCDALIARAKPSSSTRPTCRRPAIRSSTTPSGTPRRCARRCSSPAWIRDVAAENVGYFTAPYAERKKVGKPVVDREKKEVRIAMPNGVTVVARYFGSQGCITLPRGADDRVLHARRRHEPSARRRDARPGRWATCCPAIRCRPRSTSDKLQQAVDAAFAPADAYTSAFVVTYKGRMIAERYSQGITAKRPLESWSMGKSVTATHDGHADPAGRLHARPAGADSRVAEPGRPRASRSAFADIMHMSSGLRIKAPDRSRLRPARHLPRPSVSLHGRASTRSTTLPRARSSGRRTRSAAIATPIPC